ncbi:hypothetical protein [Methylobacterium thuringiense]|uniref:Uncharacterized protein n=1 Tax=Methylobacterium thuringiense TaxID=1003091 RepID=A0ABQ4TJL6_9HYPH|nr:hypothetical protein [Methylobacterium thuringiense]GJE55014.1 hypothetical protein EKPJFOCH_1500 [Methylobacterium thuringiense]
MDMDLSEKQRFLLLALRRNPMTFTGQEPQDEHLAMLQLWMQGLVDREDDEQPGPIKWRITKRGSAEASQLLR